MASRPNILIVMYDQLSPSALGCYGNEAVKSPALDRLAREGVVFDAAYTNSPLCTPARYCLMTGQLPSATRGYDNAAYLASTIPTFAHYLRAGGYRTALSGKMHFVGPDQLHGFESRKTPDIYPADFGWTPDWRKPLERIDWWYHNMDSVINAGVAEVTNQLLFDDEVGFQATRALHDFARSNDERPFLLMASFTHPHDPYVTRQKYWDRYEGIQIPMPEVPNAPKDDDPHSIRLRGAIESNKATITEEQTRSARRAYYGNVSYVDDWTASLLGTLDALGLRDDTVVIALADHGDMLGERGLWYKMNFFEGSARIPLIIHAPKRFAARRVAAPVSLVDILPTLMDLGEIRNKTVEPIAGASLLPLCEAGEAPGSARGLTSRRLTSPTNGASLITNATADRTVIGEYMAEGSVAPIVMIRRGSQKFVHCPADPDQLYDLASDPNELTNLALDPAFASTVQAFRTEVGTQWNLDDLTLEILADQARRRLINKALRSGKFTPWDYTPPRDGSNEYMRNHLDLNEVERGARWPR
jgi:choline-sulfatase